MKKIKVVQILFVVAFLLTITFSGCLPWFFIDGDYELADKKAEEMVEIFDSRDADKIKKLFAPNMIAQTENFDQSVNDLLEFYKGDYVSFENTACEVIDDKDAGHAVKDFYMSRDIKTTESVYRVSLYWRVKDNKIKDEVGIWSMYLIKFSDDPYTEYTYWGDGKTENGIHFNKTFDHAGKLLENVLGKISSKQPDQLDILFSAKIDKNSENYKNSLSAIIEYCNIDFFESYVQRDLINETVKDEQEIVERWQKMSFDVNIATGIIRIAIFYCDRDLKDYDNSGIWSLYVIKPENGDDLSEPYWGDGLWTDGINIGKIYQGEW